MHLTHLNFILAGVLLAKDPATGKILKRYEEGDILVNENLVDVKVSLNSKPADMTLLSTITEFIKARGHVEQGVVYGVEGNVSIMQIKNRDFLNMTEDYRKARHIRITKFLQEKTLGQVFKRRDNVWCDQFL